MGMYLYPGRRFLTFCLLRPFWQVGSCASHRFLGFDNHYRCRNEVEAEGLVWFWITIASLAALHVPLILFIPWTTKWIPVLVIIPIGIADLYAMLWVVSVVGKYVGEQKTTKKRARSH
jgi:hypothetical protein